MGCLFPCLRLRMMSFGVRKGRVPNVCGSFQDDLNLGKRLYREVIANGVFWGGVPVFAHEGLHGAIWTSNSSRRGPWTPAGMPAGFVQRAGYRCGEAYLRKALTDRAAHN